MIGIIVVTHDTIGKAMVSTVEKILSDCRNLSSLAIDSDQLPEVNRTIIQKSIDEVDDGDGVIILSDMFGGTPTNLCLPFLEREKIEVIGGVNLPMIIKMVSLRDKMPFGELASFIKQYGQKNIVIASEVLNGKVDY